MSSYSIYDGIHGLVPEATLTDVGFISAFMSLSLWLVLEFHIQVFRFFKKRRGLYFWSLLVLSWGVLLHSIGYLLNWFAPNCPWQLYALMDAIGWSMLVTAESLVLYSRMHLVTRNHKVHRFVLGMIIFTALFVQIPNWCISIPAVDRDPAISAVWSPRDSIETRIQQVAFLLQEGIISSMYIWYTGKLLKPNVQIRERRVMLDLIFVNAAVIILDVVVIVLAFTNEHLAKEPLQNLSYALKLKLEFFVLNQLLEVSKEGFSNRSGKKSRYVAPSISVQSPDGRFYSDDSKTLAPEKQEVMALSRSTSDGEEKMPRPSIQSPANAYFKTEPSRYLPSSSRNTSTSPEPIPLPPNAVRIHGHELKEPETTQNDSNDKSLPPTPRALPARSWLDTTEYSFCDGFVAEGPFDIDMEANRGRFDGIEPPTKP
ncbi:hypothetical protein MMC10_007871 [Thelotrema lepadinum]|nr:hypothetical protein [Thelotrema lepadinum]